MVVPAGPRPIAIIVVGAVTLPAAIAIPITVMMAGRIPTTLPIPIAIAAMRAIWLARLARGQNPAHAAILLVRSALTVGVIR